VKELSSMNAYILAGGESKRMNADKAFLTYRGKPFLEVIIECTSKLFDKVFLVGKKYDSPSLAGCLTDEIPNIGPLAGILSALKHTDKSFNFFIAVDYPLANRELILFLSSVLLRNQPLFEGLIPYTPDGPHPLLAFYSRSCRASVEQCIAQKRFHIRCICHSCRILNFVLHEELSEKEFQHFRRCFLNINSNEDYLFLKKYYP
jgi:molybdopterin-guanine dinucleotide biosynthesis protein A